MIARYARSLLAFVLIRLCNALLRLARRVIPERDIDPRERNGSGAVE